MPLYEYECQDCGEPFELLVRSPGQQVEAVCPKCGSSRTRKAISLFGCRTPATTKPPGTRSCGPAPT